MSLSDFLSRFLFLENTPGFQNQAEAALTTLYNIAHGPSGGATELLAMINSFENNPPDGLRIIEGYGLSKNLAKAYVSPDGLKHEVRIDFIGVGAEALYIGSNGVATHFSSVAALAHELAHIYYGPTNDTNPDPAGLAAFLNPSTMTGLQVDLENEVHVALGEPERVAYQAAATTAGNTASNDTNFELVSGFDYTPSGSGTGEVDVAFVDSGEEHHNVDLMSYSPNISYLFVAGDLNDTLIGGNGNDYLYVSGGNDSVYGGLGNDYLSGGDGNDGIVGGVGADTIVGGIGDDTASSGEGFDVVFGDAGNDLLVEDTDIANQTDGGNLFGGSGNDTVDAHSSVDASSLYGGSGDDTLFGNGASTLDGGSGADVFHIVTGPAGAGQGDTISGGEAHDELWIDGIKVTEASPSVMFGFEIGEPGDPALVPFQLGSQTLSPGVVYTAPIAVVFRIVGMASDSTGKVTDVVYDAFVFKNVSMGPSGLIGSPEPQWRFDPANAVAVIHDFRQGDFGLFQTCTYGYGGLIHNGYNVAGRLVADGIDYYLGQNLSEDGPPHEMSKDAVIQEHLVEEVQEKTHDGTDTTTTTDGTGTGNDDFVAGNDNPGNFSGFAGNDIILTSGGNDTAVGGTGDDFLSGGNGGDSLTADDGNDTVFGDWNPADTSAVASGPDADLISGGQGSDYLSGDGGSDTLDGGTENDTLLGGTGADSLLGGANDDSVDGGTENDVVMGEAGNDTVLGGAGTDIVYGGAGNDAVQGNDGQDSVYGDDGNDAVSGGAGNDALFGGAGDDTLVGASENDALSGGAGADNLQGGYGQDTYSYAIGDGNDVIYDSGSYLDDNDTINFTNIASTAVQFGRVNNDLVIYINDGSRTTIQGHYHTSNESVEFAHFSNGVTVNLVSVIVQTSVLGTAGDDFLFGVNSTTSEIIDGFAGNDSINAYGGNDSVYGSEGNDTLLGGSGNDLLYGAVGNDSLDGGTGNDTLYGGDGNDVYLVDSATDAIFENPGEGTDTVLSSVTWTLGSTFENLTLIGTGNVDGTGNDLNNVIVGTSLASPILQTGGVNRLYGLGGNDTIIANEGADTLDGGTGADSMVGGDGSDSYIVDSASDVTVELSGQGVDSVASSVTWTLDTYVENLTLTGSAAINGTGSAAGNVMVGNAAANALYGLAGIDTLTAGDGNDTLDGGTGNDSMTGGLGDDLYFVDDIGDKAIEVAAGGIDTVQSSVTFTIGTEVENLMLTGSAAINGTGNAVANVVTGNGLGNSLSSLGGNDTIFGGGGDDTLDGGTGTDSLSGGIGNDTYIVDVATDVVVETADEGTDNIQSSVTLTLALNVEALTLTGTTGLGGTGNAGANTLTGNTGANSLAGLDGNDTIIGGAGNDTLDGGLGNDSLVGGAGNDTYVVDSLTDVIVENAAEGTDLVQVSLTYTLGTELENLTLTGANAINGTGNSVANVLTGNTGANLLTGLAGNDTIVASDGNDTLDGGVGADSMTGGLGDDLYIVGDSGDIMVEAASAGTDTVQSSITVTVLATNVENLTLMGTTAINGTGNTLANVLIGNSAANILTGGAGNDTISGGAGDDTYVVDDAGDVLTENAGEGADLVQSTVAWALGLNFENLTLLGTAGLSGTGNAMANTITGNTGANSLAGLDGNDTIIAGAGNDTLDGGLGNDSLVGGAGNDTFVLDATTDVVVELAGEGTDLIQIGLTYTLAAELENLTLTGIGAINGTGNTVANVLIGNIGANLLSGLAGNDTITASDGNDTLDGGVGADSMTGGLGDDLYILDYTGDIVVEAASAGTDTVQSSITVAALATNVENLTLTGTTAINGTGNTLANILTGNSAANALYGGSAADTLIGGAGNDTLDGGATADSMSGGTGDDLYVVDLATDILTEAASEGTDTVQSAVAWTLATNFENLTLTGSTGVAGTGNAVANILIGNSGANALSGLAGNDTITGGAGNDTVTGGIGADQFVFTTAANGIDVITDFNEVDGVGGEEGDVLRFDAASKVGVFVYLGTSAFSGGSDNSEARVVGNQVLFDANGDGTADITITLTGLTAASQLAATDFLFV